MVRFRLGSIPIRIRPTVLLIGGYVFYLTRDWLTAIVWMAALVIAVLTHELGHALVVRRVGSEPAITVWAFGGYTAWRPTPGIGPRQRFAISAAGSALHLAIAATSCTVWRCLAAGSDWEIPALTLASASLILTVMSVSPASVYDVQLVAALILIAAPLGRDIWRERLSKVRLGKS